MWNPFSTDEFPQRRTNFRLQVVQHIYEKAKGNWDTGSTKTFLILIIGNFETAELLLFKQEPHFLYLTGLSNPGLILAMEMRIECRSNGWKILEEKEWIWQPPVLGTREVDLWAEILNEQQRNQFRFLLSSTFPTMKRGECLTAQVPLTYYSHVFQYIVKLPKDTYILLNDDDAKSGYLYSCFLDKFKAKILTETSQFPLLLYSCYPTLLKMRQNKSPSEIKALRMAIGISLAAHKRICEGLSKKKWKTDWDIEAVLACNFVRRGANFSYYPIVVTGDSKNVGEIPKLHAVARNLPLQENNLLLVDGAASYFGYCADITRTFPISGKFSDLQQSYYKLVVDQLEYVAKHVCPGRHIYHTTENYISLQDIAKSYLKSRQLSQEDLDRLSQHGIGHHIGLETHDPETQPLAVGNIIALETGYYSPSFSIRVENVYIVVDPAEEHGIGCKLLSPFPSTVDEIEKAVQSGQCGGTRLESHF